MRFTAKSTNSRSVRWFLIPLVLLLSHFHQSSAQSLAILRDIDPRLEFGVELYANNLVERAKETLLEVVWDEQDVFGNDRAEAYFWLGWISYNEGNVDGAWFSWDKLLEQYPNHSNLFSFLPSAIIFLW